MPLARIVTSTPEQVASLSEYLRSRGYTVELVDPGTCRDAPADLELDLQGCGSAEAMSRGIEAAEGANSRRRAIAYDITGRPVEFVDEQDEPAAGSNAVAQAWQGLRSAGRRIADDLSFTAGRLGGWLAEGRRSIEEYRARYQQRSRQAEEKQQERESQWQAREADRSRRQQEESARRSELRATQERLRRTQEQARREEQAERERRLLESYRREARRDAVHERFQVEQGELGQKLAAAETTLARRDAEWSEPRRSPRDGDWKKAAVVAIALALLATLGYATYQNRQPAAPLSNRDLVRSQDVSQPVPFGAAIVPPPQTNAIQPAAPAPQANTTSSGRDTRQGVSLPQGDVAVAPVPTPARAVRKRVPRRNSSYEDDPIADDQVIIHRSAASTSAARTSNRTGTRHISDLEQ